MRWCNATESPSLSPTANPKFMSAKLLLRAPHWRPRRLLSFNESRHSYGLSHGNNCETPFHFGWINNRNIENVSCAHRFPLVIFSRPWVTDTRPINASGDAWQNRAIAFINTNGGSPRARQGVLQWGCVSQRGVVCNVVVFFSHRSYGCFTCVYVCMWNACAQNGSRGKNAPGERGSRDEGRMAFVSSTLRFVGFSRLGDALSNLSAD